MAVAEENVELAATEQQPPKPMGRAAIMEMYKAANPDAQDEINDESLLGFAHDKYSEIDGKYNDLNGANTRLAELVAKDPKLGAVLSMMVGDEQKSFPYAAGRVYGREPFELDGDELEEFEKGYQENLAQLAESRAAQEEASKNIEEYKKNLTKYGKDNGLDENQLSELNDKIYEFADNMLMGIIPIALIDVIHKGISYDRDVQEAADTGFVEGKNQTVEAKMKKKTEAPSVPDLGNSTGAGSKKKLPSPKKGTSFYDSIKEV